MEVSLKRTDKGLKFEYQLKEADGQIVNLTSASVIFKVGDKTNMIVNNNAVIKNPATSGLVEYTFTEYDTLVSGSFIGEFEVIFQDGRRFNYPRNGYISVNVLPNVDGSIMQVTVDLETTLGGRLSSLEEYLLNGTGTDAQAREDIIQISSQLAQKATKGQIVSQDLSTATDAGKIKLINLADEVQQALTGNAPALATITDGSITTTKYANDSITNTKTNFVYKRASVALGNIRVNTATKNVSWDNLVVVYEEHYKQPVAGSKTYSSTLSNIYYNQGTNTIEVYAVGNFTGLTTPLSNLSLIGTIYGSKLYNVITPEFWILNNVSLVPPSIVQNPKSFWEGKKANFLGDSITDYSTYPEKVKEILGLSIARNYGVGGGSLCYRNGIYTEPIYGDNSDQMIDTAYPPVLSRWQTMDDDADIIFVLIGTNDYSAQVPLGSVSIYSDTEFNGGLNTLLDGLRTKYPTKLIIVSNLLRRLNDLLTIPLSAYNAAIKDRCESRGIVFFDAYNGTGLDFKKDLATKHTTTDGLHPNLVGDDILAHRVAAFINSK